PIQPQSHRRHRWNPSPPWPTASYPHLAPPGRSSTSTTSPSRCPLPHPTTSPPTAAPSPPSPPPRATGRGLMWQASTTLSPPPHPISSRSHRCRSLPRDASPGSHGGRGRGRKTAMVRSRGGRRPDRLYPLDGTTNFIHGVKRGEGGSDDAIQDAMIPLLVLRPNDTRLSGAYGSKQCYEHIWNACHH
ncbi:unnamed protein product, partial [Urochloa humidicola]